ncbi:hypothetical protein BHE74_00025805 [Ensete ventricosum]|nr:hypothetical protein GW17_00050608 [Ensete ventricosum]RWW66814.1 hypothetical protein BHE74_00025805 [Ensete ventricosum]RZR96062.1 hypothetical protein BHM03_00025012 [Ensete ventricosum]
MGSRTSTILQKNATVINFTKGQVSIGFSRTVSKFQNTGHSQRIHRWEVIRARFCEKT